MDVERAECPRCLRSRAVRADGRLRQHRSLGTGICRGSGRYASRLLDEKMREIAELSDENRRLAAENERLRSQLDIVTTWLRDQA